MASTGQKKILDLLSSLAGGKQALKDSQEERDKKAKIVSNVTNKKKDLAAEVPKEQLASSSDASFTQGTRQISVADAPADSPKKRKYLDNNAPLFLTNPPPAQEAEISDAPNDEVATSRDIASTAPKPTASVPGNMDTPKGNKKGDNSQILGFAFSQLAPLLVGGLFGGSEGAAQGYETAQGTLNTLRDQEFRQEQLEQREAQADADREAATLRLDKQLSAQDAMLDKRLNAQQEQFRMKQEAAGVKESAQSRLAGLGGEEKKRFDNVVEGIQTLRGMERALAKGGNTFSVIGDNEFTVNERLFGEALGRMQSGGAITEDEQKNFLATVPKFNDSEDIRRLKLRKLKGMMQRRLGTLGFEPGELGLPSIESEERENQMLMEALAAQGE